MIGGRRIALALLLASSLIGCASQPPRELAKLPGTPACFYVRTLFSWVVLDPQTLIVYAPSLQSPYLLKLLGPIPGLTFNERLGFQSGVPHNGRMCSNDGYVIQPGPVRIRQAVTAVRALTVAEAAPLIAAAGKPRMHRKPARAPAKPTTPAGPN